MKEIFDKTETAHKKPFGKRRCTMKEVIEFLTYKLGHEPTADELCEILNGAGLIRILEAIR